MTKKNEFGQIIKAKPIGGKIKIQINEFAMLEDVVPLEENENEKNNKSVKYFVKKKVENN